MGALIFDPFFGPGPPRGGLILFFLGLSWGEPLGGAIWATWFCLLLQTFHTTPSPTQTSLIVKKSTHNESFLKITDSADRSRRDLQDEMGPRPSNLSQKFVFDVLRGLCWTRGCVKKTPKSSKTKENLKLDPPRTKWAHNLYAGGFRHGDSYFDGPGAVGATKKLKKTIFLFFHVLGRWATK